MCFIIRDQWGRGLVALLFAKEPLTPVPIGHINRKTCSTVIRILFFAFSVFIASSIVVTPLTIGKNASIPTLLHAAASGVSLLHHVS